MNILTFSRNCDIDSWLDVVANACASNDSSIDSVMFDSLNEVKLATYGTFISTSVESGLRDVAMVVLPCDDVTMNTDMVAHVISSARNYKKSDLLVHLPLNLLVDRLHIIGTLTGFDFRDAKISQSENAVCMLIDISDADLKSACRKVLSQESSC